MSVYFICKKSVSNKDYSVGTRVRRKLFAISQIREDTRHEELNNNE